MAEDQVTKPAISAEDLKRLQILQSELQNYREQLKPRYEAISKELTELVSKADILLIMEFEGKNKFSINITWDDKPVEVVFKFKKTG